MVAVAHVNFYVGLLFSFMDYHETDWNKISDIWVKYKILKKY